MQSDARLLTLTQWVSPTFPIGAFAYSHGLEGAVAAGWVSDGDELFDWLRGVLEHGSGRSDAAWLSLAHRAGDEADVLALNAMACAFAASSERVREAKRQGQAFVRVANAVWGTGLPDLLLPVALGRAARSENLDIEAVCALYLQAFLSNLVAAAQRLMPLGQTQAQRILSHLSAFCLSTAKEATSMEIEDITSTAFLSDIAAMKHETLEPRLFQS